jgi:hypothetical protein
MDAGINRLISKVDIGPRDSVNPNAINSSTMGGQRPATCRAVISVAKSIDSPFDWLAARPTQSDRELLLTSPLKISARFRLV